MTRPAGSTAALAALAAMVLVGCSSVGTQAPASTVPTASPPTSATPAPPTQAAAASPSATGALDLAAGFKGPGRYAVHAWLGFEFTAGDGWLRGRQNVGTDFWILPRGDTVDTGWFWAASFDGTVFTNPCTPTAGNTTQGGDPAALLQHLRSIGQLTVTAPTAVIVAGYAGQTADVTANGCGSATVSLWPLPAQGNPIHFDKGEQVRLWAIDVGGKTVVFAAEGFAGSPDFDGLAEASQALLDSMTIIP